MWFAETFSRLWTRLKLPTRLTRDLVLGLIVGITFSLSSTSLALLVQGWRRRRAIQRLPPRPIELRSDEVVPGVIGLIGNTPLVRINSLSDRLGVEILGKAEYLNPGGSVKDRVALQSMLRNYGSCGIVQADLLVIEDAEEQGLIHPNTGSVLFEGTVGSTGISLATVGRAKGYGCCIVMPDDVAMDKVLVLEKLGAKVERVRPASIIDEKQFVNLARKRASEFGRTTLTDGHLTGETRHDDILVTSSASPAEVSHTSTSRPRLPFASGSSTTLNFEHKPRGFFADQFENDSNYKAHYNGTGPEILRQTGGMVDAFVSGAGTGGTISGIANFLKKHVPDLKVVLSDPEGSGLFNKVKYNVMYDPKESEGKKRRHQVDTVVEGIGINRITQNLAKGLEFIDDAYRISDEEAVAMSRFLVQHDGLYLGSSSACNLLACVRVAKRLRSGSKIVTILCDAGHRHQNKFWSDDYLAGIGITPDPTIIDRLLDE